jgi:lipopolysaccharide export system permease protein
MQLIDRYILKLFLSYLVAGFVVFITLYLTVDVVSFATRHDAASTTSILKYFAYHTPYVMYQLMPVVCLMATLFTLSSLNKTNELVALFSLGVGLTRVALPILIMVALISGAVFAIGDQVLPLLIQKRRYVEYVEIEKHPGLYSTVKTNKIWYRSENILFNIKTLNPEVSKAQGITLYYFAPNWELTQLIAADEVEMKGSSWLLKNGLVTLFAAESSFPLTKSFTSKVITMNEELKDIQTTSDSAEVMSLKELSRFIDHNREAGLDNLHRYEVDYHAKFGFAFASLVMSMVGVPFSVGRTRSGGTFVNLGICLAMAFAYWIAYSSALTLGKHGALPPIIAAWGPNFLTMILALFLFKRLKR